MKKVIEQVQISEGTKEKLQEYWFSMNAMQDLINKGITAEIVLQRYEVAYKNYNQQWEMILKENFTTPYADMPGYDWECNFTTNIITITG